MYYFVIVGVFSDVHMLALMYAGELCYWCWSLGAADSRKQTSDSLNKEPPKPEPTASADAAAASSSRSLPIKKEEGKQTSEDTSDITSSADRPSRNSTADTCSNSGSLEQSIKNISLEAGSEHCEAVATNTCSRCSEEALTSWRQLYSVMEHCCGEGVVQDWNSRFDPLKRGQELLSKYIEVARGPLKAQEWKYERAVQLLVAMKKSAHAHKAVVVS